MIRINSEDLRVAVAQSKSWDNVYRLLGCKPRSRIQKMCLELNIDTSHFTGQGWNKDNHETKVGIEVYLSNQRPIKSIGLKRRLFNDGLKQKVCEVCHRTEWNEKPIPLELHHINGDNSDNTLSNLQIICPNCHALTDNYRGANQERVIYRAKLTVEEWRLAIESTSNRSQACLKLGIAAYGGNYQTIDKIIKEHGFKFLDPVQKPLNTVENVEIEYKTHDGSTQKVSGVKRSKNKYPDGFNWRKQPHPWARKVERPSKEDLEKLIWEKSILQLSKELGVGDNAIRKWCRLYGITNVPPVRYWPRRKAGWTHEEALESIKPKQPLKRFTDDQVIEILQLLNNGKTKLIHIAKRFDSHNSCIINIRENITYKHIPRKMVADGSATLPTSR